MYYYRGEKIGKFDIAYEKIFASKEMTRELVTQLIETYTEDYVKDLFTEYILAGYLPNKQTMIEGALDDLAEGWYGAHFKESGAIYKRGDFAFEDWEGLE